MQMLRERCMRLQNTEKAEVDALNSLDHRRRVLDSTCRRLTQEECHLELELKTLRADQDSISFDPGTRSADAGHSVAKPSKKREKANKYSVENHGFAEAAEPVVWKNNRVGRPKTLSSTHVATTMTRDANGFEHLGPQRMGQKTNSRCPSVLRRTSSV